MAGTHEGGKKAAETRGHEGLSEAGKKGGQASSGQKATGTEHEGRSTQEAGSENKKSGQYSQSGRSDRDED